MKVQDALKRLIAGEADDADLRAVQQAMFSGQIVFMPESRDVSATGDLTKSIVITGDHNNVQLNIGYHELAQLGERLLPTPHGLPPPASPLTEFVFVGRNQALSDVKARLGLTNRTARGAFDTSFCIVYGLPGVGKTTLVTALSRDIEVMAAYPDGVLWTSLDQSPQLMSKLIPWGRALGRRDLAQLVTAEEAAAEIARTVNEKRMLLIVDDVWDAGHLTVFQQAMGKQCALLVTTRLPEVADTITHRENQIYSLPVLTEHHAVGLMRILAPALVAQHPQECLALVNDLECLPLALSVAARLLRVESRTEWGITDLLTAIRAGAAVLEAQAPADRAEGGCIPTVAALLQKSTDLLDEQTRTCFALLGVFASKPATFSLPAMAAIWEGVDPKLILRKLLALGLIEHAGKGRFQMHALLVAHAKSLCEA